MLLLCSLIRVLTGLDVIPMYLFIVDLGVLSPFPRPQNASPQEPESLLGLLRLFELRRRSPLTNARRRDGG
ncbi:hypothetical protein NDU88_007008 [Pleurodeles waltl]|uniref:Secreted protein n=1 Tax=Pleurodeles waltl TaxID=8319 RepID=A0AAV7RPM7_PLEWA|nr:hypothetical protein NDU88_007008 [Pleurodeles waltl]